MNTSVWGPTMWKTLHLITFSYPEKPSFVQRKQFYDFFNNLRYIIPCVYCRKNYIEHLNEIPIEPYLDNNQLLIKWLIDIHNLVNKKLNKPMKSYSEVFSIYKNMMSEINDEKSENKKYSKKYIIFILISLIIILFFCFLYFKFYNHQVIIN